jgi:5-methylcytosine-specific restriction endonuclease McrA
VSGRSAKEQTSFRFASPESCPALVLNADFRPLSYFPLSVWPWQETVKAVFMGRVNIVSHYDNYVRSPSFAMRLPSVVSLKSYIPTARRPAFTRFNVFLRDRFTCQYCGRHASAEDLTFDHVVPKSMGGLTTWENVVAACEPCNLRKGGVLPKVCGMHPRTEPFAPTVRELQENGRAYPPNHLHHSWRDFLYWDSELEPA